MVAQNNQIKKRTRTKENERRSPEKRLAWLTIPAVFCLIILLRLSVRVWFCFEQYLSLLSFGPCAVPYVVCYDFFRPPHLVNLPQAITFFYLPLSTPVNWFFFLFSRNKEKSCPYLAFTTEAQAQKRCTCLLYFTDLMLSSMAACILKLDFQGENGLYVNNNHQRREQVEVSHGVKYKRTAVLYPDGKEKQRACYYHHLFKENTRLPRGQSYFLSSKAD